jgi:hypothetical protein
MKSSGLDGSLAVLGVGMTKGFFKPAFATLTASTGVAARRPVTE